MFWFIKCFLKYFLYFISTVTVLTTGLIIYLLWFQPPFYFPKPTGQYAVGVQDVHWIDTSRKETLADDPTHPNRELMVSIWYPSQEKLPEKPETPFAPYLVDYCKKNQKMLFLLFGMSRPIYSYAKPDAQIDEETEKFPVIIFSHGFGSTRDNYGEFCEDLASNGFIVAGISHTCDASVVQFPDGHIVAGMESITKRFEKNKDFLNDKQLIETWNNDVGFVIDHIEKLNQDKHSIFYHRIDIKNIGMAGHSFGGSTAIYVCSLDSRVKAGVDLDGALAGYNLPKSLDKPFMFILAGDTIKFNSNPWNKDDWKMLAINSKEEEMKIKAQYLPAIEKLTTASKNNCYTFVLKDAGHMTFCDSALAKHASLFSFFLNNFLAGSINGFRATEIVNAYLVNFFDKYLKDKSSELLDGKGKKYTEVETMQHSQNAYNQGINMKFEKGTFEALNKNKAPILIEGTPVTLEWYKTTDHTTMVELQKQALPVLAEAFADEVRNFLLDEKLQFKKEYAQPPQPQDKKQPDQTPNENPFIATARLSREKRVAFSQQQWDQWFTTTAQSMQNLPFTYFLVLAKNNKGKILGVTAFYVSPSLTQFFPEFDVYQEGDVVLDPLAIHPAAQGIGLSKPLIFSILTLAPKTKRILVGTRIWIANAIALYKKLGFREYKREGIGVKFEYVVKK